MVVELPLLGGCPCGQVRYALGGAPLFAYVCHCHDCQKASGSAFTVTLVVSAADLEAQGAPSPHRQESRRDRVVDRTFCPECRALVFASNPAAPEYTSLPAGSLDDASWVVPISQSFVESAIPWAIIPGVTPVPWSSFDYNEQGAAWRATAPKFQRRGP